MLKPAERIFEHRRAEIEGIVYPTIDAKVDAVERILQHLDTDPERVTSLIGWRWIADALDQLPNEHAA